MVSAKDVIRIYQYLLANGIQIWLCGGWGIDALLGEQTRPHKDLDVIMLLDDVIRMRELLGRQGYDLAYLWEENCPAVDAHGVEVASAFVLNDADGRELDAHAMRFDVQGNGIPTWRDTEGLIFKSQDLAGQGVVAGFALQCLSSEMQMLVHRGYELPEKQVRDLELLRKKFGPW